MADEQMSVEEAFHAGFNKTDVSTPEPTDEPQDAPAEPEPTEPKPDELPADNPSPSEDDTPLTRAELKALQDSFEQRLRSNNDQVYGRMGGMLTKHEQRIRDELRKELLASLQSAPEFSDEQVKSIKARFDELGVGEIGDVVGETFKQAFAKRQPAQPTPPAFDQATLDQEIDKRVQERVSPLEQRTAEAELTAMRPNWREERNDPGFRAWLDSQPNAEEIASSPDPHVAVGAFRAYDAVVASAKKAAAAKQDSDKRLSAAVAPTKSGGTAAATITEADAFRSGFRNVMK